MTCDNFLHNVGGYFRGTLAVDQRAPTEAHGSTCPACGPLWRTCHELTCREFVEFLNDYLDGQLAPERKAVFERHLGICVECRNYLDAYRKTMALSVLAKDEGPVPPPPPELVAAILAALKQR